MRVVSSRSLRAVVVTLAVVLASAIVAVAAAGAVTGPLVIGGDRPQAVSVSGTKAVWADRRYQSHDVFCYDALTGQTTRLTDDSFDQLNPVIEGSRVIWEDWRTGNADLWAYDMDTRMATRLTATREDQRFPSLSGDWVVYRESNAGGGGYSPSIVAYDMVSVPAVTKTPASAGGAKRGAPRISGNVIVWDQRDPGRNDFDVWRYDLGISAAALVAGSDDHEGSPATDGRYVVWVQGRGKAADIRGYDVSSGTYFDVCTDAGEQAEPKVSDGVAYWVDNLHGRPLHIDSRVLPSGTRSVFRSYGTGDVAGFSVDGGNAAWLERYRSRWRVRAVFTQGTSLVDRATQSAPLRALWSAVGDSRLVLRADNTPPRITKATVKSGARRVPRNRKLVVYFSERLARSSVNRNTVQLIDSRTGKPVRATLRYSALSKSVTIVPTKRLGWSNYTIRLAPEISDASGRQLGTEGRISFSTVRTAADITAPTAPYAYWARVSGLTSVAISWYPSVDASGVTEYVVRRYYRPMDAMSWSSGSLVARVSGTTTGVTTATVTGGAADETFRRYTYYYAIQARDEAGNWSFISANVVPNVHGAARNTVDNTNVCRQCHTAHGGVGSRGQMGALSAGACYECHGTTNADNPPDTLAYGAKSTMDIQGEFGDETPSVISTGGPDLVGRSIHRDSRVAANQTECAMCHDSHLPPADWYSGSYVASTSYPNLLKGNPAYGPAYMKGNAAPYTERWCWGCHGASSVSYLDQADIAGTGNGSLVYAEAAGDHESGFTSNSAAAHRSSVIPAPGRPSDDASGPVVSCWACHGVHRTGANSLTDWRLTGTTGDQYAGPGLCYECHATAGNGADETRSTGTRPYTWNKRDVKAEFQRASHHPTSTTATMVDMTQTIWSQSTQAEFLGDTLYRAVAEPTDLVDLETYVTTTAVKPRADYLFFIRGNTNTGVDAMEASSVFTGAWNNTFTPAAIPAAPGVGAQSATKNGYLFTGRGGGNNTLYRYTEPNDAAGGGSWATTTDFGRAFGAGSGFMLDTTHNYLFAVRAGSSDETSRSDNFAADTPAWQRTSTFRPVTGGREQLGAGSAAAWVPANGSRAERLYVINKDGTNSQNATDGGLYHLDDPDTYVANEDWAYDNAQPGLLQTTSNAGTRMAWFRLGGTDYLYVLRGGTTAVDLTYRLGTDASGTVTTMTMGPPNPFNGTVAEGTELLWNGQETTAGLRIYAIDGGSANWRVLWRRTGSGSFLQSATPAAVLPATTGNGSHMGYLSCDPGDTTSAIYYSFGTVQAEVTAPGGYTRWGEVAWTENNDASCNTTVSVEGWNGSTWVTLVGSDDVSPASLTGYTVAAYSTVRVTAGLTSAAGANTARLTDWTVTAVGGVPGSGMVTCVNCHNTHLVASGTASAWNMSRTSDPVNTKSWSTSSTDFCLRCHDGTPPVRDVQANTLVPYTVGFRDMTAYALFPGWDKTNGDADFKLSGHYTASVANGRALCENCHDPHGSEYDRLLAWTKPAGVTWTGTAAFDGTRDNTSTKMGVAVGDFLCLNCHGDGSRDTTAKAAGAIDIHTSLEASCSHPTTDVAGIHTDTETGSQLGTGTPSWRHAECVDCHNPHAARAGVHTTSTAKAGNVLLGATGVEPSWPTTMVPGKEVPSVFTGVTIDETASGTHYEAQVCFKCHSDYAASNPATWAVKRSNGSTYTYTDQAMEFNPNNHGGHNVVPGSTWPMTSTAEGLRYDWALDDVTLGLGNGWRVTSMLTCSDCHANDGAGARGPHGSASLGMVDAPTAGQTRHWYQVTLGDWDTSGFLCDKCHTSEPSCQGHTTGTGSHDQPCERCHIRIPHGWKRPRLLRRIYGGVVNGIPQDTLPYTNPAQTGLESVLWSAHTGGIAESDCNDNCTQHGATTSVWP